MITSIITRCQWSLSGSFVIDRSDSVRGKCRPGWSDYWRLLLIFVSEASID